MHTARLPARQINLSVLEFTSADQLRQHYASVKRRLNTPIRKPPPVIEAPPPCPDPIIMEEAVTEPVIVPEVVAAPEPAPAVCAPVPTRLEILHAVSKVMDVPMNDLTSLRRNAYIVRARFVFYAMAKVYTASSFPAIAKTVSRDHSTVMHGLRRARGMNDDLFPIYCEVCKKLRLPLPQPEDFLAVPE